MVNHAANDAHWEKKLRIRTAAARHEKKDDHHSPYEPTSYAVLERLAASGEIGRGDVLIDYGCGKGRVSLFLSYAAGCCSIGIEYDSALHAAAQENRAACPCSDRVSFILSPAEAYTVTTENRFYFFNPFSENILRAVLGRIRKSWYENPREIRLFFYYTQDAWLDFLSQQDALEFSGEIDCRDLFHNDDPREKIMIYQMLPV